MTSSSATIPFPPASPRSAGNMTSRGTASLLSQPFSLTSSSQQAQQQQKLPIVHAKSSIRNQLTLEIDEKSAEHPPSSLPFTILTPVAPPLSFSSSTSLNAATIHQLPPELTATISTPHRPPLTATIDPKAVRPRTSGTFKRSTLESLSVSGGISGSASSGNNNYSNSNDAVVDALAAKMRMQALQNRSLLSSARHSHQRAAAAQKEAQSLAAAAETLATNNAQLLYLSRHAALQELELSVLRREGNHYKDSEVEALIHDLNQTRSQLKLAEEDISILLGEKKNALKSVTTYRREKESFESRARVAENVAAEQMEELKAGNERYSKLALEYDRVLMELNSSVQKNATFQLQLEAADNNNKVIAKENETMKTFIEDGLENREKTMRDLATLRGDVIKLQEDLETKNVALSQAAVEAALNKENMIVLHQERESNLEAKHALEQRISTLETEKEISETTASNLTKERNELRRNVENEQNSKAKLEMDRDNLQRDLTKQIQELDSQLHALKRKLDDASLKEQTMSLLIEQRTMEKANLEKELGEERSKTSSHFEEIRALKDSLRAKQEEVGALSTEVTDRDNQIATLKLTVKNSEDATKAAKDSLAEAWKTIEKNTATSGEKLKEISSMKSQLLENRAFINELTTQLQHEKDKFDKMAREKLEEIYLKDRELNKEKQNNAHHIETISNLEAKKKTIQEQFEALQTTHDNTIGAHERTLEAEKTKYSRLEQLYEKTCREINKYSVTNDASVQKYLDEITTLQGELEVAQAHLFGQKQSHDALALQHENLVTIHRSLNSTAAQDKKRLTELELKLTEMTQLNKVLALNGGSDGISRRSSLIRSSLGGSILANIPGLNTTAAPANDSQVVTPSVPVSPNNAAGLAAQQQPAASDGSIKSPPTLGRRASLTLSDTIVSDALELGNVKKELASLKTQYEEIVRLEFTHREKLTNLFETCEEWKNKYEDSKKNYDELVKKMPFRSNPSTPAAPDRQLDGSDSSSTAAATSAASSGTVAPPTIVVDPPVVTSASAAAPAASTPAQQARSLLTAVPLAVGLLFAPVSADEKLGAGVNVTSVKPNQAAALSGFQAGDVILSIHNRPTHSKAGFLLSLKGLMAGDKVQVSMKRNAELLTLPLILGGRDKSVDQVRQMRKAAGLEVF